MPSERIIVDGLGRLPQFAHAGVADDWVFVSGTLGTGDDLRLVDGGIGPETTQTLTNIGTILKAAGAGWDDVVKVNVSVADMADFPAMNSAYAAFFDGTPPARITVGGLELALDARVEIDCVARRPSRPSQPSQPSQPSEPTTATPQAGAPIKRTTGFVEHDGESLYYEVVGEGGVPLVLSHGAGGNHAVWFQQVATFARDRAVVIWDHRAYGRSTDHADRSSPEVAVGDLLAICDHLGIERADLVGQSMGGWTSVGVALARPALVRSLVLADSLGGFTSPEIAAALAAPRAVAAADRDDLLGHHPAIDTNWASRNPERAHLYQSLGRMGTADPARIIPRLLAVTHDADEAAAITCRVLCLVGDRDPLFPTASVRALTALFVDARIAEIPGCGHSPYFEDPETWNLLVGRFLAQLA
ncbi:MAG: alpha/beta fold hydrolase [Acidimicrobiales bacterium]